MKEFEMYIGETENCYKLKLKRLVLTIILILAIIGIPFEICCKELMVEKLITISLLFIFIKILIRFLRAINNIVSNNTIIKFYITSNNENIINEYTYKPVYNDENYKVYCLHEDYKYVNDMELIYGEDFIENIIYNL